jgi:hypothetical protein
MKRFNTARLGTLAALTCAGALTSEALAQEQPTAAPAAAHGHWDPAAMRQHMQERWAAHLKAVHDALNIRPDQETAFAAYAAAMSPAPGAGGDWQRHKDRGPGAPETLTTPQRLDQMARRVDERTTKMREAFERRAAATKALYAALDPNQQHTMDALHGLMEHEGWRRGGHERGGGRPGPGTDRG